MVSIYNKEEISGLTEQELKVMDKILEGYNEFLKLEIQVDKDHIHMMIESEPKLSPLMIVRVLKQQSTYKIYEEYPISMKKYFWNENTFWTDGYFCSTIGEVSQETLRKYIENQG